MYNDTEIAVGQSYAGLESKFYFITDMVAYAPTQVVKVYFLIWEPLKDKPFYTISGKSSCPVIKLQTAVDTPFKNGFCEAAIDFIKKHDKVGLFKVDVLQYVHEKPQNFKNLHEFAFSLAITLGYPEDSIQKLISPSVEDQVKLDKQLYKSQQTDLNLNASGGEKSDEEPPPESEKEEEKIEEKTRKSQKKKLKQVIDVVKKKRKVEETSPPSPPSDSPSPNVTPSLSTTSTTTTSASHTSNNSPDSGNYLNIKKERKQLKKENLKLVQQIKDLEEKTKTQQELYGLKAEVAKMQFKSADAQVKRLEDEVKWLRNQLDKK